MENQTMHHLFPITMEALATNVNNYKHDIEK